MRGSDTPGIKYGIGKPDYRALFYSNPEAAIRLPVTISKGWGVLPEGSALSINASADGNVSKYLPYDPVASITGKEVAPGRAYLIQDGAASTAAYVTLADSYKFAVGDDVFAIDSDASAVDCGAITAIDRTTYPTMAVITVTNNVTTGITVAKFGYLFTEGGAVCKGILESAVDTGVGEDAADANASMVISNATFYTGCLRNIDAAGITDLSGTTVGQFTYIK
jgi:hypothetical protein